MIYDIDNLGLVISKEFSFPNIDFGEMKMFPWSIFLELLEKANVPVPENFKSVNIDEVFIVVGM